MRPFCRGVAPTSSNSKWESATHVGILLRSQSALFPIFRFYFHLDTLAFTDCASLEDGTSCIVFSCFLVVFVDSSDVFRFLPSPSESQRYFLDLPISVQNLNPANGHLLVTAVPQRCP